MTAATARARASIWAMMPMMDIIRTNHLRRAYRRLGDDERAMFEAWLKRHLRASAAMGCEIDPYGILEAIKDAKDGMLRVEG